MTDLNVITIIGRVTRDLNENSFGYVGSGIAKMTLSIAVNRSVKKADKWEDEASFFDVLYWGKAAEAVKPYIHKGTQIAVKGSLVQQRWEKDGEKKSKIIIQADSIQLVGGKAEKIEDESFTANAFKEVPSEAKEAVGALASAGLVDNPEFPEDIPF